MGDELIKQGPELKPSYPLPSPALQKLSPEIEKQVKELRERVSQELAKEKKDRLLSNISEERRIKIEAVRSIFLEEMRALEKQNQDFINTKNKIEAVLTLLLLDFEDISHLIDMESIKERSNYGL